ncbi:hypothetical protein IKG13_01580 [Candidatus Saccharibacteria bacterium]|jgi:hypothetical protein|nr:hypothetical protein [Candidatus Saccharibacteria bacterium]
MRKIDFEGPFRKALEENISEVREAVLSKNEDMWLKIRNYSERFDLPIKYIEHKILSDNIFANQFAKDPRKQSLHQRVAADFIKTMTGVFDFCPLPAGGRNALYICNDGIVRKGSGASHGLTKSIDFCWRFEDCMYYAAHKHTEANGGAQDNQSNDLTAFLINASKSTLANTYFIAIGDGDYYQRECPEVDAKNMSRLDYMNEKYGSKYAYAMSSNDLEAFMIEHSGSKIIKTDSV